MNFDLFQIEERKKEMGGKEPRREERRGAPVREKTKSGDRNEHSIWGKKGLFGSFVVASVKK